MFRTQRVISHENHEDKKCDNEENIEGACAAVLASVEDRRENGGTREVIRVKTLSLIEALVGSLAR